MHENRINSSTKCPKTGSKKAIVGQKWPLCAQKVPKNPTTAKLLMLRGASEATWSFLKQRTHENHINSSAKWPKWGQKGPFLAKDGHHNPR
jgi:hypothetical protein